ncbi:MAG: hypothetical protein PVI81_08650 [Anaerolineales bacterium]
MLRKPWIGFLSALVLLAVLTSMGPVERSLGVNVRIVYLHGVWVWTALLALGASALLALPGAFLDHKFSQRWSKALGQAGMLFWITYLPLSIWTMQANWNGLYLAEPRFKIGLDFAVIGVLLQAAILIITQPRVASILNLSFFIALVVSLNRAEQVMHPPSPIMTSDSLLIRGYFFILLAVAICTGILLTLWIGDPRPGRDT